MTTPTNAPGNANLRRLIVNADDFGRSSSINQAVLRAHRQGILTSASLMVNEKQAAEAVQIARANPALAVGLHLALVCAQPALPQEKIPALLEAPHQFSHRPVGAGWRYFADKNLRGQLRDEIAAQFEKFHATGLPLDHVNGHLHFHMHPVVLGILLENARRWQIRAMRLTRDRFFLNARLARGQWGYRLSHAVIFGLLSRWARPRLAAQSIRHTGTVFGLLQNGRVEKHYVRALLEKLPPGDSELYSHPSLDQCGGEFEVLIDPAIRGLVRQLGIRLIRYQDL